MDVIEYNDLLLGGKTIGPTRLAAKTKFAAMPNGGSC